MCFREKKIAAYTKFLSALFDIFCVLNFIIHKNFPYLNFYTYHHIISRASGFAKLLLLRVFFQGVKILNHGLSRV